MVSRIGTAPCRRRLNRLVFTNHKLCKLLSNLLNSIFRQIGESRCEKMPEVLHDKVTFVDNAASKEGVRDRSRQLQVFVRLTVHLECRTVGASKRRKSGIVRDEEDVLHPQRGHFRSCGGIAPGASGGRDQDLSVQSMDWPISIQDVRTEIVLKPSLVTIGRGHNP